VKRYFLFSIFLLFLQKIIFAQAEKDSIFFKKEAQLKQDRFRILINKYYDEKFDKNYFKKKIPITDSNIDMDIVYQALFNSDSTRFVAFFIIEAIDSIKLRPAILIYPNALFTKQYLVCGILQNNKWYFNTIWYGYNYVVLANTMEERKKDFFNFLQGLSFFKESSTEFNPEFWQSKLFEKIKIE
jgi:hypothetical protein